MEVYLEVNGREMNRVTSVTQAILFFKTLSSEIPMVNISDRLFFFAGIFFSHSQLYLHCVFFVLLQGERLLCIFFFFFFFTFSHSSSSQYKEREIRS